MFNPFSQLSRRLSSLSGRRAQRGTPRCPPQAPSPVQEVRELSESLKRYVNARITLMMAEVKDLVARIKLAAILAGIILVVAVMMLFVLELGVLALMLVTLKWSLWVTAFTLTGLHLLVIIVVGLILKAKISAIEAFPHSRQLSNSEREESKRQQQAKEVLKGQS